MELWIWICSTQTEDDVCVQEVKCLGLFVVFEKCVTLQMCLSVLLICFLIAYIVSRMQLDFWVVYSQICESSLNIFDGIYFYEVGVGCF